MRAYIGLRAEQDNLIALLSHYDRCLTPADKRAVFDGAACWARAVIGVREEILHPALADAAAIHVREAQTVFDEISRELDALESAPTDTPVFDERVESITRRMTTILRAEKGPHGLWARIGERPDADDLDRRLAARFSERVRSPPLKVPRGSG